MAVYAAAIAAVASVIDTSMKNKQKKREVQQRKDAIKAQEDARNAAINSALGGDFLGQFGLSDIFGSKPEAIQPLEVDEALGRNVNQILNQGLPAAQTIVRKSNRQLADETLGLNLERARTFSPNFDEQIGDINSATTSLLKGQLPFEDVMDIVSDRSSLAASLGTPGGSRNATLRDLGLSRLDAIQQGQGMFSQFQNTLASSVSPIPQYSRALDALPFTSLTAGQRVSGELDTVAAKQRAALIEAGADPAASELFAENFLFQQEKANILTGRASTASVGGNAAVAAANNFDVAEYRRQQAEK